MSRLLEQEGANEVSVVARNNIHNVVSGPYDTLQPKLLRLATDVNLSWAKKFTPLKGFVREAIGISPLNPTDYST